VEVAAIAPLSALGKGGNWGRFATVAAIFTTKSYESAFRIRQHCSNSAKPAT